MTKSNLPIPLPEQNSALSLRRANQLIEVTDKILARSQQEVAAQDESWMARLWAWADENRVIPYGDSSGMGISWQGLPRERQCLLELHELELHRFYPIKSTTALPPEIGQLQQLEKLELRGNRLTSIPPEIGQLQQLHSLLLSDNNLASLPPEIGQLKNLVVLNIKRNPLTTLPPEMGQLQYLEELSIDINNLSLIPTILLLKDSLKIDSFSMEDRRRAATSRGYL